jgi:thiamine biosynthesis lipoprotein
MKAPAGVLRGAARRAADTPAAFAVEFPAMGTLAQVTARFPDPLPAPDADRLAARIRSLLSGVEEQLSRFRPDSDTTRLGEAAGAWTRVGEHTAAVLRAALAAREFTEGLFDPAPRGRSFAVRPMAQLPPASSAQPTPPRAEAAASQPGAGSPAISRNAAAPPFEARLEPPGGIDFGAIGKGYAADLVLDLIRAAGAEAALVAVGVSSIAAWAAPAAAAWRIGVRSPAGASNEALGVLSLRTGAVATSSTNEQPGHLVDPRTGQTASCDVTQATVVARCGTAAEACSTALMVGGTALAARLAERRPDAAVVLVTDAAVLVSPALRGVFAARFRLSATPADL